MRRESSNIIEQKKWEILGILIMTLALLIFLGIASYHVSDYPNSGSPEAVKNWLGLAGAIISYYLYVYTIGYSCLVFPFLLFLLGWNLFLQRPFKPYFRLGLYVLALGLFLSTALAMPEAVSEEGSKYGFRLSGLLGGFLAQQMNHYLGIVGSIIVLLTGLLLFLISATSWSMREALLGFTDEIRSLFYKIQTKEDKSGIRKPSKKQKPEITIKSNSDLNSLPESIPEAPPKKFVKEKPVIHIREKTEPDSEEQSVLPHSTAITPSVQGEYSLPPLEFLTSPTRSDLHVDRKILEEKAHFLEEKLKEFDVRGTVVGIQPGPIITRFEIRPSPGVKISRFISVQDDLTLIMRASRVRVVAPIPGKAAVGIEIPNDEPRLVTLKQILVSDIFKKSTSKLTLALGLTIDGQPYIADLAQMPHLLVAGATGSGKSVCLNTIIISILYRAKPWEVKFVLIDPKKLELNLYRNLRNHHLTTRENVGEDVITTVENAVAVLKSLEIEMERRYRILAKAGVRNIDDYNRTIKSEKIKPVDEGENVKPLPYVILVVDELADLMILGAREVEEPIARLAQMSRAVGIHLILATQRPSVDVITGVIKANFPSRIAFQVAAKTDSRTILDRNGAEKLLGRGDMLFMNSREPVPIRIHAPFISAEEVKLVVDHVSRQPRDEVWRLPGFETKSTGGRERRGERDELYNEAAKLVIRHQQGSASLLQRRLRIGYARAGRLIDELEDAGIIGPFDGSKAREVLVDESFIERLDELDNMSSEEDDEL